MKKKAKEQRGLKRPEDPEAAKFYDATIDRWRKKPPVASSSRNPNPPESAEQIAERAKAELQRGQESPYKSPFKPAGLGEKRLHPDADISADYMSPKKRTERAKKRGRKHPNRLPGDSIDPFTGEKTPPKKPKR